MIGADLSPLLPLVVADAAALLLYTMLIVFVIYSFIISYHWLRWGGNVFISTLSLAIYFGGSALFLFTLFTAYSLL